MILTARKNKTIYHNAKKCQMIQAFFRTKESIAGLITKAGKAIKAVFVKRLFWHAGKRLLPFSHPVTDT